MLALIQTKDSDTTLNVMANEVCVEEDGVRSQLLIVFRQSAPRCSSCVHIRGSLRITGVWIVIFWWGDQVLQHLMTASVQRRWHCWLFSWLIDRLSGRWRPQTSCTVHNHEDIQFAFTETEHTRDFLAFSFLKIDSDRSSNQISCWFIW